MTECHICDNPCYYQLLCDQCGNTCCINCHDTDWNICLWCKEIQMGACIKRQKMSLCCENKYCRQKIIVDEPKDITRCTEQGCQTILCRYCVPVCDQHSFRCYCDIQRLPISLATKCSHCPRQVCPKHVAYRSETNVCCRKCIIYCDCPHCGKIYPQTHGEPRCFSCESALFWIQRIFGNDIMSIIIKYLKP